MAVTPQRGNVAGQVGVELLLATGVMEVARVRRRCGGLRLDDGFRDLHVGVGKPAVGSHGLQRRDRARTSSDGIEAAVSGLGRPRGADRRGGQGSGLRAPLVAIGVRLATVGLLLGLARIAMTGQTRSSRCASFVAVFGGSGVRGEVLYQCLASLTLAPEHRRATATDRPVSFDSDGGREIAECSRAGCPQ